MWRSGADKAYWIPRFAAGDLVRLTTDGHLSTLGGLGKNTGPRRIAKGPDHTLWVTLDGANKIARVSGWARTSRPTQTTR